MFVKRIELRGEFPNERESLARRRERLTNSPTLRVMARPMIVSKGLLALLFACGIVTCGAKLDGKEWSFTDVNDATDDTGADASLTCADNNNKWSVSLMRIVFFQISI